MKQKTDLKTLILAAKQGRKFKTWSPVTQTQFDQEFFLSNSHWFYESIIGDWEVEFIKEADHVE